MDSTRIARFLPSSQYLLEVRKAGMVQICLRSRLSRGGEKSQHWNPKRHEVGPLACNELGSAGEQAGVERLPELAKIRASSVGHILWVLFAADSSSFTAPAQTDQRSKGSPVPLAPLVLLSLFFTTYLFFFLLRVWIQTSSTGRTVHSVCM